MSVFGVEEALVGGVQGDGRGQGGVFVDAHRAGGLHTATEFVAIGKGAGCVRIGRPGRCIKAQCGDAHGMGKIVIDHGNRPGVGDAARLHLEQNALGWTARIERAEGDKGGLARPEGSRLPDHRATELHIDFVAGKLIEALVNQPSPVTAQATVGAVEIIEQPWSDTGIGGGRVGRSPWHRRAVGIGRIRVGVAVGDTGVLVAVGGIGVSVGVGGTGV